MMRNLPKRRTLSALLCLSLLPLGVFACGDGGGSGSSGGASSTATSGGTTGQTGAPTTPPAGAWLKGDLHVHTSHSGDTDRFGDDVETSIKIAEYAGLDYVVLGDHRQTTILSDPQLRGTATSLVVIPGMEWGGGGHAGAHGIFRDPPYMTQTGATAADKLQSIQDTIADVHNQGGFFSLNHPVDPRNPFGYPVQGMDGIEIWNGLWALRAVADLDRAALDDWTVRRGFPASGLNAPPEMLDAVSHLGGGKNHQALKLWEAHLNAGRQIAAVGGGDRHYLFLPGAPTTKVFAAQRTQQAVVDAIRAGRTMVQRSPLAPETHFTADRDGDGVFESIVGDVLPLGPSTTFRVQVRGAVGGKVRLIKNGQLFMEWNVNTPDFVEQIADQPGQRSWYRVDVLERLDMSFPQADNLKLMVTGFHNQSWINSLGSLPSILSGVGGWALNAIHQVQDIVETGGPAALWLLLYGQQMGTQFARVQGLYPIIEWPEHVNKVLNLDLADDDFCKSVFTSPIWVR